MTKFNNYKSDNMIVKHKIKGYTFLLYLSFVWLTFYSSSNSIVSNLTLGYGKLFLSSENLFYEIFYILTSAALEFAVLEVLFYFYRQIISYKVYTFVVPDNDLKLEFRTYFIIRNIILGLIMNVCFLYPFLYNCYDLFKMGITLFMVILFAFNISKKYSEPIIAHFVFKNFYMPILIYEIIIGLYNFLGAI